jgi:hypothetical protein
MRTVGGRTDYFGRVLPSQRFNNQDVAEFRASLLLKPSDTITNTTIFTYHTDNNRQTPKATFLRPGFGFPTSVLSLPPYVADVSVDLDHKASSTWAVINTTTVDLSDSLTLKNIFGHIHAKALTAYPQDTDGTSHLDRQCASASPTEKFPDYRGDPASGPGDGRSLHLDPRRSD